MASESAPNDLGISWSKYHELTDSGERTPDRLTKRAVEYVSEKNLAIDLGAGNLRNTRFIADSGFKHVIAYDGSPSVANMVEKSDKESDKEIITTDIRKFEDFDYPPETFDLIFSRKSLNFINPQNFDATFSKILASAKPDGIVAITMFGDKDPWNDDKIKMTFKSLDELKAYFKEWEIIIEAEREVDDLTSKDEPKRSHYIWICARKK